ncbi:MAG: HAD family phosphatase [Phycisphaerales bacterium]
MARAVIFDFDGVIVHSEPTHLLAVREVVEPLGVRLAQETYYERYVHLPDRELLRRLMADSGHEVGPRQLEHLLSAKHDAFEHHLQHGRQVHVYPGVLELIRACAARVPVGLCTAAQARTVRAVLGAVGGLSLFHAVTTADDVPRSKPDPLPYQRTAELLGIPAPECVAIEDTVGGLTSAKGAGCRALAVGHTLPKERLTLADRFVDRIADITVDALLAV